MFKQLSGFSLKNLGVIRLFLTLVTLVYFVFIAIYTINEYDLGFQLSMIGRLKSGELIYKDFDYVRPFLNIIFWDFLMKICSFSSDYLIVISRLIVVLQSLVIAYFIQKIIFEKANISIVLFLSICFLHSFPIMPWHTIDGIFFAVIGLYLYKKNYVFCALFFLAFSALTKQSFFIFGIVTTGFILFDLYKKRDLKKQDLYLSFGLLILFIYSLYHYKILENYQYFIDQVFSTSTSSGFFENSIATYFFSDIFKTLILIFGLVLIYFLNIKRAYYEAFLYVALPIMMILPMFNHSSYNGIHSLFLILLVLFIKFESQNKFLFFIFLLAWTSSISWGYSSPIFFTFILVYKFIKQKNKYLYFVWAFSVISFFAIRLKYTYLTESILDNKFILASNVNAISGTLISENEYLYILETQSIENQYKNVIFLPGSPLVDIVNNKYPNRASWEMDVEYPSWNKDLKNLNTNVIVLDNRQNEYQKGFYKSSFATELIKSKKIIKTTKYFTVYGN